MNRAVTSCPKGHPYDERNTLLNSFGWRYCRECNRTQAREGYHRRKAAQVAA